MIIGFLSAVTENDETPALINIIDQRDFYKNEFEKAQIEIGDLKAAFEISKQEYDELKSVQLMDQPPVTNTDSTQTDHINNSKETHDNYSETAVISRNESCLQTEFDINIMEKSYQDKIKKVQNNLDFSVSQHNFLKSSFMHAQQELDKAYRITDSLRAEKEKIISERENLKKQIPILESVKQFIEVSFQQSQAELGVAKSQIDKLNLELETISEEKVQAQSNAQIAENKILKLNSKLQNLQRQLKSVESERQSVESRLFRSQKEMEQHKSNLLHFEKIIKSLELEKSNLESNLESKTTQLAESIHDANGLRSLNQKLLADYNSLTERLFKGADKNSDNGTSLSVLDDLNSLLDETRSNEMMLFQTLEGKNAKISELNEKIQSVVSEKKENEENYQKAINDLTLKNAHQLEV